MSMKEKILDKSDSYNFYKEGYENYKSIYETAIKHKNKDENAENLLNNRLIDLIQKLTENQEALDLEIANLKKELESRNNDFSELESEYELSILNIKKEYEDKYSNQNQEDAKSVVELSKKVSKLNRELNDNYNKINKLKTDLDVTNKRYNDLKSDIKNKYKVKELNDSISEKDNKLKKLQKDLNKKNAQLRRYRIPFHDFEEYLVESYVFPFVRPPFSKEAKHCFSVMEDVATYLCNKAERSHKPLISVIMPVYNRKDVVMKAIDSVLAQTYENFELVVVDDASTDGTTELLQKINHDKVKVVFHEKNKYASGARNTGLKNSTGEYIAYLDSDNLLDERYLAATVGAFLELPDAGGLYSAQYRYETYDSKPFAVQFGSFNKSLIHNHNYVDMNCFAHRREVYENIGGFDETLKGADDWELILKISTHYKIYSVPFLLSKCYLGVVDNRVTDLVPTDTPKIRAQNEVLPTKAGKLDKKVTVVIPIFESSYNLQKCLDLLLSLNLDNLNIVVSINSSNVDLKELNIDSKVKLIQSNMNLGFTNALNQGIEVADNESDILILHQNALMTEGAIESMQKYAYNLPKCGLVVSQQVFKDGSAIKNHVPYAHDDYWCDITPSKFYKNILRVPMFHDGEFLELKSSPFFCTYLKRDVLEKTGGFNSNLGKHYHSMHLFSEYVRFILGLKIYHISDAVVINNAPKQFRNEKPVNEYYYNDVKNSSDRDSDDKGIYKKYVWDF